MRALSRCWRGSLVRKRRIPIKGFHLRDGPINIRPIAPDDAPHLMRWLNDPNVLQYYEGRDQPQDEHAIRKRFLTKQGSSVQGCAICYHDRPIGYIQVYPAEPENLCAWGFPRDARVAEFDLFIGEPDLWGQVIGSRVVQAVARSLTTTYGADQVVVDPRVHNHRAVHVYEKCGFKKVRLLPAAEWHEGQLHDCWLMQFSPHN
ncbi:MAG: GNAT family N-acetyltransferase [Thermaerobacter sp.]|nr:GNAT family N-acetyltransferase [Thermaerobacter sp.]